MGRRDSPACEAGLRVTAGLRLAIAAMVAGIALGPVAAAAQDAPTNTTSGDNPDAIGPRELQNFNLQGQVTRQAQPQETPAPPRTPPRAAPATTNAAPVADNRPATSAPPAATTSRREIPTARSSTSGTAAEGSSALSTGAPPLASPPAASPASSLTVALPPVSDPSTDGGAASPAAPGGPLSLWPWLAALLVAGGLGFVYWRSRQRHAFAGGPEIDDYVAPRASAPQPAPAPAPAPTPAPTPKHDLPVGLVSTRLRPWLDLGFRPLNCTVDNDNVVIEFELELFNSGNSPARAILVEASYFNPGPEQDRQIERFFNHPVAEGGRAASLAPLKRMVIRNRLVTPRTQVQEYEVDGRKLFVPLIGFNALYRWSSGEGQTSASFMLGRKTGGDKMAPLRLDMGDQQFHALGDQPLPVAVRH